MILEIDHYATPLGEVTIASRQTRLCAMTFSDHWPRLAAALARRLGGVEFVEARDPAMLRARLDAYFAGDLTALDAIAVEPAGTDFQRAVWTALRRVPAGATVSYSALAGSIGAPSAVRAVGAANGANPIWLVIPCHRAIGADGSLTGYAGGLDRKRWLLDHEGAQRREDSPQSHRGTEIREVQNTLF
ncbi:MAG: methylated-DNA--[protein]-cysteine S-methyltransferase [bacterium]